MPQPSLPKNRLKCSRCGSEDVVIVRRYSGEALCRRCLRESLLGRIRRTVSRYGLLERKDRIIFLKSGLPRDLLLLDLFKEIESKFPVTISVERLPPSSGLWDGILTFLKHARVGDAKLVLPLVLDDAVALLLRFILRGTPNILLIKGRVFVGLRHVDGAISPFVEIPLEELLALGESEPELRTSNPYLVLVQRLEAVNPGMRFNVLRISEREDFLRSIGIVFR